MFGKFFEWLNINGDERLDKKAGEYEISIDIDNYGIKSRGTEEIMQKIRIEHENEVSSENPYYFSETTSDRKYYNDSPHCSGVYLNFVKEEVNEIWKDKFFIPT